MWIARVRIRHDCVIGNRCRKFNVTDIGGIAFDVFRDKGKIHAPQIQTLSGKEEDVEAFIKDVAKDPRVKNLEREGNAIFFVEVRPDDFPSAFYNSNLFFYKPVTVDTEGFEYWEVASWKKSAITDFIKGLQNSLKEVKVEKIQEGKLTDIYFAHFRPNLSKKQKRALELALEMGYYQWPKKADLKKLANAMNVSVQTFREHLKKAEHKVMPDLIRQMS
jgi:predicted DNA binding protein